MASTCGSSTFRRSLWRSCAFAPFDTSDCLESLSGPIVPLRLPRLFSLGPMTTAHLLLSLKSSSRGTGAAALARATWRDGGLMQEAPGTVALVVGGPAWAGPQEASRVAALTRAGVPAWRPLLVTWRRVSAGGPRRGSPDHGRPGTGGPDTGRVPARANPVVGISARWPLAAGAGPSFQ